MATTTETVPWTKADVALAFDLATGLTGLMNMVVARPDVAPLLAGMLGNLINPVRDAAAMATVERAAKTNGGAVSDAKLGGKDVEFGPVRMWLVTDVPPESEPATVGTLLNPPAAGEVPVADDLGETQAMPALDDEAADDTESAVAA